MMRIWLIALLCATFGADAVAQDNPNSPRGRREMRVNPPPRVKSLNELGEAAEQSKWGTYSNQVGKPQWGTFGGKPVDGSDPKFRIGRP
jgi:hypothetical protein